MSKASFAVEEIVEFVDAPSVGCSLFVQATWSEDLPEKLPESPDAVLCRLLACDGSRCWEGTLKRGDLSGPLGDSWGKPSNLRLLLDALASRAPAPAGAAGSPSASIPATGIGGRPHETILPVSEATWSCSENNNSPLSLAIRFIYREGPVIAVRGIDLPPAPVGLGLSRFFTLAHEAQKAASACMAAAEQECAQLQQEKEALQQQLEALPKQAEEDEKRLLKEMAGALNNQKRRCLKLWQASCQTSCSDGLAADLDAATVSLMEEPATISLEAATLSCLDREVPPEDAIALDEKDVDLSACSAPSLVFASESLPPSVPADALADASAFTFTIPLTLGMGDNSHGNHSIKASSKRSATAENFVVSGSVRRKVDATQ